MVHIKQAFDFVQNRFKERVRVQRGAQRAANFVEHVEFLCAARGLLNEVAIFDGHSDLVAQRQQEAELRSRKPPCVGRTEE